MSPLSGLRVLDATIGPAGGVATMALGDFGADVVKLEPPSGDPFRRLPSAPWWLRGKRSAALDARDPAERTRVDALVDAADVVVASEPEPRLRERGLDWERVHARNPAAVHCSITGFGARGTESGRPGYEALVAARCGRLEVFAGQALRDGPVFAALPTASHAAAFGAVGGIAAALFERERSGCGRRVETSLLRGMLPYDLASLLLVQLADRWPGAPDPKRVGGGMPTLNYHPVMCADGRWIQLGNLLEHHLFAFLDAVDLLPELLADERFCEPPARWSPDAVEHARDRILLRMRERNADEWMETFRANGNVAAEIVLRADEALAHPDLVGNGDVFEREHPDLGPVRQLGVAARLNATPGAPGRLPPRVGEHTGEVLAAWAGARPGSAAASGPAPAPAPETRGRPLHGVTVLEVATIIAAPLATSLLADLGARVVKIEPIDGDPYRHLLPRGLLAVKTNAGKQSVCANLKSDAGRAILRALAERADVLVHNFRPGVPERLGIDDASLAALNPDLIRIAATGYGPDAPGAARPCAHPVAGAAMGGVALQAGAGMPPADCAALDEIRDAARRLMRANEANPDPNTSVVIAAAAALALLAKRRRGVAQAVSVNMLAANAYANADGMLAYRGVPPRAEVDCGLHGFAATYRLYETAEGWLCLAIGSDASWQRFADAVARPRLASDARFATAAARREHEGALAAELEALFRELPAAAWEERLGAARVGCVRVRAGFGEFLRDDPLGRALTEPVEHARFGAMRRWGPLVVCDEGPPSLGPGALAGEHTDALLREIGYSEPEIAALRDAGVVASEPVDPLDAV